VLLWALGALATPDTSLRTRICAVADGGFARPATIVTSSERALTPTLQGRPWDACARRQTFRVGSRTSNSGDPRSEKGR
jgi:hypothetical protein